jgi:hypothetical protein
LFFALQIKTGPVCGGKFDPFEEHVIYIIGLSSNEGFREDIKRWLTVVIKEAGFNFSKKTIRGSKAKPLLHIISIKSPYF